MLRSPIDLMAAAIQAVECGDLSVLLEAADTGRNRSVKHPPVLNAELQAAVTLLNDFDTKLRTDAAAAFSVEVAAALALVRRHDPAAWAKAKQILKKHRVGMRDLNRCIGEIATDEQQPDTDQRQVRKAGDMLPDCPAPKMVVPANFTLDENGTYERKARRDSSGGTSIENVVVTHAPVVISGRLEDIDTGTQALQIHWRRPDGWHDRSVDRAKYIAVDAPELWERLHADIINVQNGLFEVRTGVLEPHSPDFLSPVQIPVKYDPAARCPAWEKFIREVFPQHSEALYVARQRARGVFAPEESKPELPYVSNKKCPSVEWTPYQRADATIPEMGVASASLTAVSGRIQPENWSK